MADSNKVSRETVGEVTKDTAEKAAESIATLTVDIDCSEALTGLKAVQREARKAAQSLREFEAVKSGWGDEFDKLFEAHQELAKKYDGILVGANDQLSIQGADGNWNYDEYMHGMYNGMELIIAQMEGREPEFREAPEKWIKDEPVTLNKGFEVAD